MHIILEKEGEERDLSFVGTVSELLAHLKINPEEVVVARGDQIVDSAEELTDADTVHILSVVSGG